MSDVKSWGERPFWGLGSEYDPQWLLDEEQKKIQTQLIELCRTTLRSNAVKSDETYEYPRANMDALASIGLLSLIVPKEMGGRGQNHRCCAMVVETIARYGCPSTAMVFVMHIGACSSVLLRCHDNKTLTALMGKLDSDKLIGTEIYSDPATGGHIWYPLTSKCWQQQDGNFKALKYGSWATSAGFADWYVVQMTSPNFAGDYSNLSNFLFYKDEIRASTDEWSALGMHGNQSGPAVAEATLTPDRLIGPIGDGSDSNEETVNPFFMLNSSCCWNGISMATIDIAKRHVTNRGHSDVGVRVCDYPTIQDYFGEVICATNSCRLLAFSVAALMDEKTNNNDWSIHKDHKVLPRKSIGNWLWQLKFEAARNVSSVTDTMLHACGGSGYKTDLGLERLLRDGKAGWMMGPSNEVLRQMVGKSALLGMEALDIWANKPDERSLNNEIKKLSKSEKAALAEKLLYQVKLEEENEKNNSTTDNDKFFDHPFNTAAAQVASADQSHKPALDTVKPTKLKLKSMTPLTSDKKIAMLVFDLPSTESSLGTLPGQYVEILIPVNGKKPTRYMSPVSAPNQYGQLEIVVRYENQGVLAQFLKELKIGQQVEFRGPCGGFEYRPSQLSHLILVCAGTGVTPAIQIIRSIASNVSDNTKVTLLYQARDRENLIFKEELDSYKDKRLNVVCTLQDPDGTWSGHEGEIGRVFLASHLPNTNGCKRKVVLCGGPAMVMGCLDALYQMKYPSEEIFVYGPFGAQQIRAVFGQNSKLTTQLA